MRLTSVTEGFRFCRVAAFFGVLVAASTAEAELVFTENVSINELQHASDEVELRTDLLAQPPLSIGDSLTISYRISQPAVNPGSDADSVVYDHVAAIVKAGNKELFNTDHAELTVWNLNGFYGIAVNDFSGPLLDFLASTSPTVLSNGFLAPDLSISDFDSAAGGSVFADGEVIGFRTDSYQFSGDLPPSTPVPEPSSYGAIATAALFAVVFGKQLRSRTRS